ncbi:MAG: hypothetical protein A2W98_14405 [Bacteroidetes bacterium GWF2_33_38]|nr:MAG: hypothetical protein A2W98_14405 [Bacteroidetes bacterium GWF2_33_38]OFY76107.1 MAG: hypothetical protein A2265_06895 [Bacteroidetes bacterium RIFOXYA12_FULL_33_9]
MSNTQARDIIFDKIKSALIHKIKGTKYSYNKNVNDIFENQNNSLELTFAEEFNKINGKFIFCIDTKDFNENIKLLFKQSKWTSLYCVDKELQKILTSAEIPFSSSENDFYDMEAGFTGCEYLIARTGSVLVSSAQSSGRRIYSYSPNHIVFAKTSQLAYDAGEAMRLLIQKYDNQLPSMISMISGPSRTADIEKTLIMGAHGPKNIFVFLINNQ